jgi:nucleoside-triphosphatase
VGYVQPAATELRVVREPELRADDEDRAHRGDQEHLLELADVGVAWRSPEIESAGPAQAHPSRSHCRSGLMPTRLLVEARPGAGKTTAFRRLAELLPASPTGFITEEMRERRRRVGFAIEAFSGERGTLAHIDFSGPPRVGKYGVDLAEFERVALPALREHADVVLIDELGKMELASESFRAAVEELLDSGVALAATVQASKHPFTDRLKRRLEVVRLTRANRDELPAQLAARLVRGQSPV